MNGIVHSADANRLLLQECQENDPDRRAQFRQAEKTSFRQVRIRRGRQDKREVAIIVSRCVAPNSAQILVRARGQEVIGPRNMPGS